MYDIDIWILWEVGKLGNALEIPTARCLFIRVWIWWEPDVVKKYTAVVSKKNGVSLETLKDDTVFLLTTAVYDAASK